MSVQQRAARGIERIVYALAIGAVLWLLALLSGCAQFSSRQIETTQDGTQRQTQINVWTLFDAKSDLTKLRATTTDKTQGLSLAGLDQSASSTNFVEILRLIAAIAAAAK